LANGVTEGILFVELKFSFLLIFNNLVPLAIGVKAEDEIIIKFEGN
jgi:hypothetical protein